MARERQRTTDVVAFPFDGRRPRVIISRMVNSTHVEYISVEEAAAIIGCTTGHVRHLLGPCVAAIAGKKLNPNAWLVVKHSAIAYAAKPQLCGRPRRSA